MGAESSQVTTSRVGISQYSPVDVDSYIDKSLIRSIDPTNPEAHVLYTKKPVETEIPIQIVFNDFEFLEKWNIAIADLKDGKKVKLSNEFVDDLIGGSFK